MYYNFATVKIVVYCIVLYIGLCVLISVILFYDGGCLSWLARLRVMRHDDRPSKLSVVKRSSCKMILRKSRRQLIAAPSIRETCV